MAIKAKKANLLFQGQILRKWKKYGHFYYEILPQFYYKSGLNFSNFSKYGLEIVPWPFLAFVAISRPKIEKMDKIRSLSLLNLKKFLK